MTNIILLIVLFYLIFFFSKIKIDVSIGLWGLKNIIYSYFVLFCFILIFVIFFRLIKIFQIQKVIDLKYFYYSYDFSIIVLLLLIMFFIRKIIFFYAKLHFFKLHYPWLSVERHKKFSKIYAWVYFNIIYKNSKKMYYYFFFINIFLNIIFIIFIFIDIILNNYVLFYSLVYLKYFGLFKLFYIWISFVATKLDATKDFYVFSSFYGDRETNPYYIDSKYDEIRKVEVEVINLYLMNTFFDFSPEFRKMLQRWSQEKAMKRQLLIKQLKAPNFVERNKDSLSDFLKKNEEFTKKEIIS